MNNVLDAVLRNYSFYKANFKTSQVLSGNINKTWIYKSEDGTKYLVQSISPAFKEPYILMRNIEKVTEHITNYYRLNDDKIHQCLKVIHNESNSPLTIYEDVLGTKQYFRVYNYIEGARSYDQSTDPIVVKNTGKAFGNFQKVLSSFPITELKETIPDFHDTAKRYENLIKDIKVDSNNRVKNVTSQIVYLLQHSDEYGIVIDLMNKGIIPKRVTHNDTKINNVMMDVNTGDWVSVIDLDTVMPGSCLFDYGDAVRSVCSKTLEDESDLSKVGIDLKLFENFSEGFLSEVYDTLNNVEIELLAKSASIITKELAIRFLNDYINGDTYFKTNYENHNLDRANNQIELAKRIDEEVPYMNEINKKLVKKLR